MGNIQHTRQFAIVVAHDSRLGIGKNDVLPWKIDEDRIFFRNLTRSVKEPNSQNLVIMGRKTWESIPSQHRPLKGRINLVLTHRQSLCVPQEVLVCHSVAAAMEKIDSIQFETCFVIGGGSVYGYALKDKRFDTIHLTEVAGDFHCDVFFPQYKKSFALSQQSPVKEENGLTYRFSVYKRENSGTLEL